MARKQAETVDNEPAKVEVKVVSRTGNFVDQVTGKAIGLTPVDVEMHPWLQVNVDAGNVIVVE